MQPGGGEHPASAGHRPQIGPVAVAARPHPGPMMGGRHRRQLRQQRRRHGLQRPTPGHRGIRGGIAGVEGGTGQHRAIGTRNQIALVGEHDGRHPARRQPIQQHLALGREQRQPHAQRGQQRRRPGPGAEQHPGRGQRAAPAQGQLGAPGGGPHSVHRRIHERHALPHQCGAQRFQQARVAQIADLREPHTLPLRRRRQMPAQRRVPAAQAPVRRPAQRLPALVTVHRHPQAAVVQVRRAQPGLALKTIHQRPIARRGVLAQPVHGIGVTPGEQRRQNTATGPGRRRTLPAGVDHGDAQTAVAEIKRTQQTDNSTTDNEYISHSKSWELDDRKGSNNNTGTTSPAR